jgi:hypothetical protein
MANERNLLGARHWSATAVRTAVVLTVVAVVLLIIGVAGETEGLLIFGGIILGAAVVAGIAGMAGASFRRS